MCLILLGRILMVKYIGSSAACGEKSGLMPTGLILGSWGGALGVFRTVWKYTTVFRDGGRSGIIAYLLFKWDYSSNFPAHL